MYPNTRGFEESRPFRGRGSRRLPTRRQGRQARRKVHSVAPRQVEKGPDGPERRELADGAPFGQQQPPGRRTGVAGARRLRVMGSTWSHPTTGSRNLGSPRPAFKKGRRERRPRRETEEVSLGFEAGDRLALRVTGVPYRAAGRPWPSGRAGCRAFRGRRRRPGRRAWPSPPAGRSRSRR